MKVLQVIEKMETGGAQRLLADMLRSMGKNPDLQLTLAIYTSIPDSVFEKTAAAVPGLKIVTLGAKKTDNFKAIRKLRPLIKDADVCHVHLFPALYHCAIASIGCKTRMVFTEHSTYNRRRNNKWLRRIERFIYNRYDVLACISQAVKINLATWLNVGTSDPRLKVIGNGVDLKRFRNNPGFDPRVKLAGNETRYVSEEIVKGEVAATRRELFGREGMPVLMVSRFVESKDQHTLIRAVAEIDNPKIFAVFIGAGPMKAQCEALALELHIEERIVFLGEREDIERYISGAAMGVQSSKWEGFGLTVVEMMAGGLPVIVSDVSGMADLVKGVGEIFPRGDYKELARKISSIAEKCEKNPGYREKLRDAGKHRAEEYDIEYTTRGYLDSYSRK